MAPTWQWHGNNILLVQALALVIILFLCLYAQVWRLLVRLPRRRPLCPEERLGRLLTMRQILASWHGIALLLPRNTFTISWQYHCSNKAIPWQYHGNNMAITCHVIVCYCHVIAMILPCYCNAIAMLLPLQYHGHNMAITWQYHGNTMTIALQ